MKDTNYAFAVAHIRANENNLLTVGDMEQLVSASDIDNALGMLADKGYGNIDDGIDYEQVLKDNQVKAWELVSSITPNKNELDFLLVKNDYHNIKAVLKSTISLRSDDGCYIEPTTLDIESLKNALKTGDYSELPEYVADDLRQAYELAARTGDGQLTDVTLDRLALRHMNKLGEETGNGFIINLIELITAVADIKIAVRGARTKRDAVFFDSALCPCATLDIEMLKINALKTEEDILEYLERTEYSDVVAQIKDSNSAFEKWCDDEIMQYMDDAKLDIFGIAPIIAYYYAKETEIRNIRIALSCITNGLPKEKIIERMRTLYV